MLEIYAQRWNSREVRLFAYAFYTRQILSKIIRATSFTKSGGGKQPRNCRRVVRTTHTVAINTADIRK